jgi:hypothetical protein
LNERWRFDIALDEKLEPEDPIQVAGIREDSVPKLLDRSELFEKRRFGHVLKDIFGNRGIAQLPLMT